MGTPRSYPNVNNYIHSNGFSVVNVKYNHENIFTKFNYRGGFGNVEGVVAHETAYNNSNISGEIAYMSRNHTNAFVHAFVDHSQIIEIHPPEFGAWGGAKKSSINVHLTEKVGNNIWYRGTLNGKTVWIHKSYLKYIMLNKYMTRSIPTRSEEMVCFLLFTYDIYTNW